MKIKIIFSVVTLMLFSNISLAQVLPEKYMQATISRNVSDVIDENALKGEIQCSLPIKTIETIQLSQVEVKYNSEKGWTQYQNSGDVETHDLSTKLINIDLIRQIKFDSRYKNKIVVFVSDGNGKENNYTVQYNSEKEALEGMKKFFTTLNNCKKKA